MVGVHERAPAADGDEAGVAVLGEDHGRTVAACIGPSLLATIVLGNARPGCGRSSCTGGVRSRPGGRVGDEGWPADAPSVDLLPIVTATEDAPGRTDAASETPS
jgi:hypothetical protein